MDDLERLGRFAMAPDVHLGEEALLRGWITQEQLDECLKERAAHPELPLGAILLRRRLITSEQLAALLRLPSRGAPAPEPASPDQPVVPADLPEEARVMLSNPANCFGKFVKVCRVGEGGMGAVWKCFDLALRRWVAVKFIEGQSEEVAAKVMREAQAAARLQHPGIVQVHEVGRWNNLNAIVMEYVEGRTLDQLRPAVPEALRYVRDAARAVDHAHKSGIIHRDIKPSNILVSKAGRVCVADFGLAKELGVHSRTGHVVGTPSYMSPEQARGQPVDARTDVYSLGATLYELVTGRPPFEGEGLMDTLESVIHREPPPLRGIDRDVRTIILKALATDPSRRYLTAADLADDIDRYLNGEPIRARPPSVSYRIGKTLAKHRLAVAAALVVLLVLAAAVLIVKRENEKAELDRRVFAARGALAEFERRAQHVTSPETLRHLRTLHLEPALREIDEGLAKGEHAVLRVVRARALWAVRDLDGALAELARALEADPSCTEAHLLRGRILTERYRSLCAARPDFALTGGQLVQRPKAESEEARAVRQAALESLRKVQSSGAALAERAEALLARAFVEYYEGRYAEMLGSINEAVRIRNYEDYDSRFYRGLAYRHLGKLDLSATELEAAVTLYPLYADAHVEYIVTLQTQALTTGTLEPLRRADAAVERALAMGIEPDKMRTYQAFHAVVRMQQALQNGVPEVERVVDEVVERCRAAGENHYLVLALVQKIRLKMQKYQDPTSELSEALGLLRTAETALEIAQRGSLYYSQAAWKIQQGLDPMKDFETSVADLGRAIKLAASDPEKAVILRERSSTRRALAKYRATLGEDPNTDLEAAAEDLAAAQRLAPEPWTLAELADVHMERARYLDAQKKDPRPAWRAAVEVLDALEPMVPGNERLLKVVAENKSMAWFQISRHNMAHELDPTEALVATIREAEKWSSLDPGNYGPYEVIGSSHNNLGIYLHLKGGDPEDHYRKAIEAYTRAIVLNDNGELYLARGQTWANLGQWLNSKEEFRRALRDWETAVRKLPHLETDLRDRMAAVRARAGD